MPWLEPVWLVITVPLIIPDTKQNSMFSIFTRNRGLPQTVRAVSGTMHWHHCGNCNIWYWYCAIIEKVFHKDRHSQFRFSSPVVTDPPCSNCIPLQNPHLCQPLSKHCRNFKARIWFQNCFFFCVFTTNHQLRHGYVLNVLGKECHSD